MSALCHALHGLSSRLRIHSFPFDEELIPKNGIYVLFEEGEDAHGLKRIVRIGTHTGDGRLRLRLREHFITENKDRSVFRKNIGRAILNRSHDPFLADWNIDRTTYAAKRSPDDHADCVKQQSVERQVTDCIRASMRFAVFRVDDRNRRLFWESRMISTISLCEKCDPSPEWLGRFSPKNKICESGLWQVNELFKEPFSKIEFSEFAHSIGETWQGLDSC